MTPLLTFLAAGTLLGVVAVYLVHEALEYEKQYKILKNKKEHQYNNNMTEKQYIKIIDQGIKDIVKHQETLKAMQKEIDAILKKKEH